MLLKAQSGSDEQIVTNPYQQAGRFTKRTSINQEANVISDRGRSQIIQPFKKSVPFGSGTSRQLSEVPLNQIN